MTPEEQACRAQELRDAIDRKNRTIARTGDEWLQRNLRQEITALYRELRELEGR